MKKMKQLVHRFRRWLIRKLGGYPDPGPFVRVVPTSERRIEKFWAEASMQVGNHRVEEFCKREALQRLMETIDQSGFIRWDQRYDRFNQSTTLRAVLMAVNPNE